MIHICNTQEAENPEMMMTVVLGDYTANERLRLAFPCLCEGQLLLKEPILLVISRTWSLISFFVRFGMNMYRLQKRFYMLGESPTSKIFMPARFVLEVTRRKLLPSCTAADSLHPIRLSQSIVPLVSLFVSHC